MMMSPVKGQNNYGSHKEAEILEKYFAKDISSNAKKFTEH